MLACIHVSKPTRLLLDLIAEVGSRYLPRRADLFCGKPSVVVRGNHSRNSLDEERLLSVGGRARYFKLFKAVPILEIFKVGEHERKLNGT